MEISLKELLQLSRRRIKLILLITILGFVLSAAISQLLIKPSYTSYTLMYVDTSVEGTNSDINNLNYAQKIVTTYINCLNTNKFFQQVADESGLDYTAGQLKNMSEISAINNTELFKISVTSDSPQAAYALTKKMEEIAPSILKDINNVASLRIVDSAFLPSAPTSPNSIKNIMMGTLFGLFAGFALALIFEILGTRVTNCADASKKCNLPYLGDVPYVSFKRGIRLLGTGKSETRHLIQTEIPEFEESYRSIRRNIMSNVSKQGCKKLIVCSENHKDGRSTCAANIGIQLAKTGYRILLVDCNLAGGNLHELFKIPQSLGIADYLTKEYEEKDIISKTEIDNLKIVSSGNRKEGVQIAFSGARMESFIKSMEAYFDYIIFDTPPVSEVSDALELVRISDGMILLARQNDTKYESIAKLSADCKRLKTDAVGIIINRVQVKHRK